MLSSNSNEQTPRSIQLEKFSRAFAAGWKGELLNEHNIVPWKYILQKQMQTIGALPLVELGNKNFLAKTSPAEIAVNDQFSGFLLSGMEDKVGMVYEKMGLSARDLYLHLTASAEGLPSQELFSIFRSFLNFEYEGEYTPTQLENNLKRYEYTLNRMISYGLDIHENMKTLFFVIALNRALPCTKAILTELISKAKVNILTGNPIFAWKKLKAQVTTDVHTLQSTDSAPFSIGVSDTVNLISIGPNEPNRILSEFLSFSVELFRDTSLYFNRFISNSSSTTIKQNRIYKSDNDDSTTSSLTHQKDDSALRIVNLTTRKDTLANWHKILGHANADYIRKEC
jgi:hypothetical protein